MPPRKWNDEGLIGAVSEHSTWSEVARTLGLSQAGKTLALLRTRAEELGLDVSAFQRQYGERRTLDRFTVDQLSEFVRTSSTWGDVTAKMGYSGSHQARWTVRRHIEGLGIDGSHLFGSRVPGSGSTFEEQRSYLIETWLRHGTTLTAYRVKDLIYFGFKTWACENTDCGITEWMGKPAPLQLDHVDGDRLNNVLTNLRFLCANCHMQTETWGNKGNRRRPVNEALIATILASPEVVTPAVIQAELLLEQHAAELADEACRNSMW